MSYKKFCLILKLSHILCLEQLDETFSFHFLFTVICLFVWLFVLLNSPPASSSYGNSLSYHSNYFGTQAVQFRFASPLTDWAVGETWWTNKQRPSSNPFCKRPMQTVLAWAGMSTLWHCPSSISSSSVKRRKLQWYGHVSRSSDLAKTILQGIVKGGRRQGRQRKRWEDNTREWTGLEFAEFQRAVETGEKWRKLVVIIICGAPKTPAVNG